MFARVKRPGGDANNLGGGARNRNGERNWPDSGGLRPIKHEEFPKTFHISNFN